MTVPQLIRTLGRIGGVLLIVAAITVFYFFLFNKANSTTIALTFLLATLGIAAAWGLLEAIVAAVVGALCFNYFFLPPLFTFYLADTQNWVALFAFLVTAVVASQLSASAMRRALDAMRQREEVERLYELSRALMLVDKRSATGSQISQRIAEVFKDTSVAVFDREGDQIYRTDMPEQVIPDSELRAAISRSTAVHDAAAQLSILPLCLSQEPMGSLAIYGGAISETAVLVYRPRNNWTAISFVFWSEDWCNRAESLPGSAGSERVSR
jgi:two-component system, OmpR family, sensor histidine kinase KdpD